MDKQKYNNYPLAISQIIGLINANDIAIPEIQRPFVWRKSQVVTLLIPYTRAILQAISLFGRTQLSSLRMVRFLRVRRFLLTDSSVLPR